MTEHTGQPEAAFLEARGTSEQRPEPKRSPSRDEATEDGQEVVTGIAQFINEGGNGGVAVPGASDLRAAVAGLSALDLESAKSR